MNDFPLLTELRELYDTEGEEAVEALVESWPEEKQQALLEEIEAVQIVGVFAIIIPGNINNPYWS